MTLYRIQKADQQEYGPFTQGELCQLILQGQVFSRTLAQVEGTQGWKQLSDFAEFSKPLTAASRNPQACTPVPMVLLPTVCVSGDTIDPKPCKLAGASLILGALVCPCWIAVIWLWNTGNRIELATIGLASTSARVLVLMAFTMGLAFVTLMGAASLTGLVAMNRIRRSQGQLTGMRAAELGLVSTVSGLFFAFAFLGNVRAGAKIVKLNACIANLRRIDGAICAWAEE